jgi:hypothetical protein
MREYRRLSGHALGADMRSGLDRMIDAATGYKPATVDEAEARLLFEFIRDYIWAPVLAQCLGNAP